MTTRSVGSPHEITTVAARAVASGDLHLCPDGRAGLFNGSMPVAIGGRLTLHTCARLEVAADAIIEKVAGALCNFNFTTQKIVASGGTNIGRYTETKAANATIAEVLLNDPGASS